MQETFRRGPFTWLAYLMLAFYGYYLNILGPITPFLKQELNLSYTVSSLHFSAFAVGMLLIGLGGHRLVARLGRWAALWTGAAGMSAAALVLIAGRSPVITIGAAFLMGLVGSLILVIVPSALADRHGEGRAVALSEANVIASMVSTAAPLLVGFCAGLPGGWRLALGLAAVTPLLMRWGFRGSRADDPSPAPAPLETAPTAPPARSLGLRFWVYWTALVLAVSVEFCMISWCADYLENSLGMLKVDAARAVSLFLGAMILGRLAGSRLVQRFSTRAVVIGSILLAGAGFAAFWLARSPLVGQIGLFVTGLGVASLYPLIISLAIGAAGKNTVAASARATLASGTAILALPLILGRLADMTSIHSAYAVVAFLLAGALGIILWSGEPRQSTVPQST